jgi:arginyl-tRNA--protein-N-Asp/Glu arginylyltransferase
MHRASEIVVVDRLHACSYLPGRVARLPYRHPVTTLTPEEFDARLAEGDRRSGLYLYRTQCPACRCCEPIRLDLGSPREGATFRPNATQRREMRRGDALLEVAIGEPKVDAARVDLFNRHREARELDRGEPALDEEAYEEFLVLSCCPTLEIAYWHEGQLVAVAIVDAGRESLSAVYTFYDPTFQGVSVGTYSVLRTVQLARETERRYLYLGFFIAQSPHMSYKARFHPHQRLVAGVWRDFA